MKIICQDIASNYNGYKNLIEIYEQAKNCAFCTIELDFSDVRWFAGNMCAPFGAILYKISRGLNKVSIINIDNDLVKSLLSKNDFLSNYGYTKKTDKYGTTIQYKRFEPKDSNLFGAYVSNFWQSGMGIPDMTEGVSKKLRESVFEIFSNSVVHSQTKYGIFSCGQFFPKKNKLDFSIADLGVGIRNNVNKVMNIDLNAEQAIEWALKGTNTTKKGPVPGGLGLKILKEFILRNKGSLQIISDNGYWELKKDGTPEIMSFPRPFPGTVVNIEINTADNSSYRLVSEVRPEDIF